MMQVLQVVRPGQPVSPPEGHVGGGHGAHLPGSGQGGGRGTGGGQGQPRQNPQPGHRH